MRGRGSAIFTGWFAKLQCLLVDRTWGEACRRAAKVVAAALIGLSLGGQVMAADQVGTEPSPRQPNAADLSTVLSLVATSPERQQLGRQLEKLLRQGSLNEAESRLNAAVDVGVLAILLLDQLRAPQFLTKLQALGIRGDDQITWPPAVAQDPVSRSPEVTESAQAKLVELKDARDREQQRADAAVRDLAAVTEELHATQALRTRDSAAAAASAEQLVKLTASFERERERADAATRDLVAITEERHLLQRLREPDADRIASRHRELQPLKEPLEEERQSSQAAAALHPEGDRSRSSEIGASSDVPVATADPMSTPQPATLVSAPVQRPSPHANTSELRGPPIVLNTSMLSLQGRPVHLFGVVTDGDVGSASELTQYIGNREVVCEPVDATDVYRCHVDRKDLSVVVLFNGGGWAAWDATPELMLATERARSARVGVWSR